MPPLRLDPGSSALSTQTQPLSFSHSPLGQGAMPTNLLLVIAPRMEPSYTHSRYHKIGQGLQAQKVSFLQYLCQTTV